MTMKMRNNQVQRGVIFQQMKQRWSCYNQSPSGRLLGVEPDYLVYFVFSVGPLYLKGAATPPVIVHAAMGGPGGVGAFWSPPPPGEGFRGQRFSEPPPRRGFPGAASFQSPPPAGVFGGSAPEAKNRCKISL